MSEQKTACVDVEFEGKVHCTGPLPADRATEYANSARNDGLDPKVVNLS
jgi:hypothetical protein